MAPSKSNKHPTHPTKSKKLSTMTQAPSKPQKPSTMARKLHQPPPVVEEHREEMTEREEHQPEEEYGSKSASASSEEKNDEEEVEEEEDGDESDSDSDDSAAKIAFTVKPVVSEKSAEPKASTPVVNHDSSSKRSAGSESVPNDSKRKKLTDNADEHDAKKGQGRVWSEQDELAIFNGLIGYQQSKKRPFTNADIGDFHQLIKKNLHLATDDGKLSDKIRRLKSKYFTKGQDQVFTKPHDVRMYELSQKIWGVQDFVVDDSARRSNRKPKSMAVSEAAGAVSEASGAVWKAAGKKPAVAEMEENVKFAGDANIEPDNFWLNYPSLRICLSSQSYSSDLSSQVMQKNIPMLGSNESIKLNEFEKEWSDIQVAELALGCKKYDARKKLTKFVLDLMDSGSKD